MEANEYQIGGDHYNKREYQHWDFVIEGELHYLLACATKYISRWRDKNGIEDLKKPSHYLVKAIEHNIEPPCTAEFDELACKFASQCEPSDEMIILHICNGDYQVALNLISDLVLGHTPVDKFFEGKIYKLENSISGETFVGKLIPTENTSIHALSPRLSGVDGNSNKCHLPVDEIRKPNSGWTVKE